MHLDINTLYTISVSILMLSAFVSGLELASISKLYIHFVYPDTKVKQKYTKWVLLHSLQVMLSGVTFIAFLFMPGFAFKLVFTLLTAVNLYSYSQRKIGKDGADQVRLLALLSYSICFLLNNEQGETLSMYFSGLQVLIGYATSGTIKLLSQHWRKGDVLAGVLGTYSFGIPKVSDFLKSHPLIEKLCSHSAITFMLFVPLSFLLPFQTPLYIALGLILSFHFMTALLMGLNDFLVTFPLAYPGVILLHSVIFKC